MEKNKQRNKKIVSCIIIASVLILSIGGYFAYPTLADMVLPKRHITNAFMNFGSKWQNSVDGLSEKVDFLEIEGELEIHIDAFPKLKEKVTVKDNSSDILVHFGIAGNRIHVSVPQILEEDILMEINLSDIAQLNKLDISSQIPTEYEQYRESCQKLDTILHEISKIDFKKHSDILSAANKDAAKGFAQMLQNAEYEKLDNSNGDVTSYKIVLLRQFVEQGINRILDEFYSDSKVLPYISILKTSAGIDKDSLKECFAKMMEYVGDVDFVVDIDEKNDTIKRMYAYLIYNGKDACQMTLHF